jgi:hypothetical protein
MTVIKLNEEQIDLAKELIRYGEDRQDYFNSLQKMMQKFLTDQKVEVEQVAQELANSLNITLEEVREYDFIQDLLPWDIIYLKKQTTTPIMWPNQFELKDEEQ